MTLDEAIIHAEQVAELNEAECFECAEEHRQLAKWLKELKELREQKRSRGEWIPVTYRAMDEEEYEEFKKEFGELPFEDRKMFSCQMPDDNQEILICTLWGGVSQDRCEIDDCYALETQGDWDGVTAWMPLPKPYKAESEETE